VKVKLTLLVFLLTMLVLPRFTEGQGLVPTKFENLRMSVLLTLEENGVPKGIFSIWISEKPGPLNGEFYTDSTYMQLSSLPYEEGKSEHELICEIDDVRPYERYGMVWKIRLDNDYQPPSPKAEDNIFFWIENHFYVVKVGEVKENVNFAQYGSRESKVENIYIIYATREVLDFPECVYFSSADPRHLYVRLWPQLVIGDTFPEWWSSTRFPYHIVVLVGAFLAFGILFILYLKRKCLLRKNRADHRGIHGSLAGRAV